LHLAPVFNLPNVSATIVTCRQEESNQDLEITLVNVQWSMIDEKGH
jgi:hypothetical protein